MSAPQGCTDDTAVIESFKEALKSRIGADRFRMWFTHGVAFSLATSESTVTGASSDAADVTVQAGSVIVSVRGPFALERLKKNFMRDLRSAALMAYGRTVDVHVLLAGDVPIQTLLLPEDASLSSEDSLADGNSATSVAAKVSLSSPTESLSAGRSPRRTRGSSSSGNGSSGNGSSGVGSSVRSLASVLEGSASSAPQRKAPSRRNPSTASTVKPKSGATPEAAAPLFSSGPPVLPAQTMTLEHFIGGACNQLACAAATMACDNPRSASPLFLFGSSGVGKTHLLHAIADRFRRQHRMRTVMVLTAEQFTNDFISSVSATGLPAFRRRYRDVDALLVDDIQFLDSKRATLREMLFTVETLAAAGRPLVFTASQSPAEISGLTRELAGRMAAGLVCPMQPLDMETRKKLLVRMISQVCPHGWPTEVVDEISSLLGGDARMVSGIVNLVGMLQRMYGRMPTMNEIRQFGGEQLRSQTPTVTLNAIERAVCETFGLDQQSLRAAKQTRSITEPRMLAMYLSRQLTSAAYNEISRHYNQKSHTSAILAAKKVEQWIETGKPIGRGNTAMSARQALDRIESLLRAS